MQVARDAEMQECKMQNARERKFEFQLTSFRIPLRSVKEKSAVRTYIGQKLEDTVCEMDPFSILSALMFS